MVKKIIQLLCELPEFAILLQKIEIIFTNHLKNDCVELDSQSRLLIPFDFNTNSVKFCLNICYFLHVSFLSKFQLNENVKLMCTQYYTLRYLFSSFTEEQINSYLNSLLEETRKNVIELKTLLQSILLKDFEKHLVQITRLLCKISEIYEPFQEDLDTVARTLLYCIPTHILLSMGGDERCTISPITKVNKYHSGVTPHFYDNTIERSSCTSSSPTLPLFETMENFRQSIFLQSLSSEESFWNNRWQSLRERFLQILEIEPSTYITFTPSGTDAEMLFSLLALSRHSHCNKNDLIQSKRSLVAIIVVAMNEVGSGTKDASKCCYFSSLTPSSVKVVPFQPVSGIGKQIFDFTGITIREVTSNIETQIEALLSKVIEEMGNTAVLHFVHCSKTGLQAPNFQFFFKMKRKYKEKLVAVVDAAQSRISLSLINEYLKKNFCVLLTGSKFFSGPPFSGAILIPENEGKIFVNDLYVPQGFQDYFTSWEIDPRLSGLRGKLPSWKNVGLLVRWEGALYSAQEVFKIQESKLVELTQKWFLFVSNLISQTEYLSMETFSSNSSVALASHFGIQSSSIISIFLQPKNFERKLSFEELREVYLLLTQDLTIKLKGIIQKEEERKILRKKIIIGQPVKISQKEGVVRLALGAPMLVQMNQNEKSFNKLIEEDKIAISKLHLIGKYYDQLIKP